MHQRGESGAERERKRERERERERESKEKMDSSLQVCGFLSGNQHLTASIHSFVPPFLPSVVLFFRCFFPCFLRQVLDCWTELNLDVSTLALAVVYVMMRDTDERC